MMIQINAHGMAQIADALGAHHILGRDHFTPDMLEAWAAEAESNYDGSGCSFEIRGIDSRAGYPVVIDITTEGYERGTK